MVGAGGAAAAGGGRGGEQPYHHPSIAPGELTAVTGGAPYLGGGHGVSSSSAGRRAAELGGRAGAAAGSLPSASSALPFPMPMAWYAPGAHDAATEAGVSLEEYRQLSHRLEPPMGAAAAAAAAAAAMVHLVDGSASGGRENSGWDRPAETTDVGAAPGKLARPLGPSSQQVAASRGGPGPQQQPDDAVGEFFWSM